MTLDVTSLEIRCGSSGTTVVQVWCKCSSQEDIDDIIGFLELAKKVVIQWEEIRTGMSANDRRERGAKGGAARAVALSPERRSEISKEAATARWSKEEKT